MGLCDFFASFGVEATGALRSRFGGILTISIETKILNDKNRAKAKDFAFNVKPKHFTLSY